MTPSGIDPATEVELYNTVMNYVIRFILALRQFGLHLFQAVIIKDFYIISGMGLAL
jgi:hypothetical protein